MINELWHFLIEGTKNKKGVIANFYSYGEHCGNALFKTLEWTNEVGIHSSRAIEASKLQIPIPQEAIRLSESVYTMPKQFTFPLNDATSFKIPKGIIKSGNDGEFDFELIKEGFVLHLDKRSNLKKVELNIENDKLVNVFIELICSLPSLDSFQVFVLHDWDDKKNELWESKYYDRNTLVKFLLQNRSDTFENGYVGLIANSTKTQLVLDDHKKVQFITDDEMVLKSFIKSLNQLGFVKLKELYSLSYGFYHWHYRPSNSQNRTSLKKLLSSANFQMIDSWL